MMTLISSLKTGNSLPMKSDQQTKLFFFLEGGGISMSFCLIDIWNGSSHYVFKLERALIYHGKFQNSKLPES